MKEVSELFEIFNERKEKKQSTKSLTEESLDPNTTTSKKGIGLAEKRNLDILLDEDGKKRNTGFRIVFALVVLGFISSSLIYISNFRKDISREAVGDIVLEMTNIFEEGLEMKSFSGQEEILGSNIILVEYTQNMYTDIQKKVDGFEPLISNEKIQEVLNYRIYKNMDDAKDFKEDVSVYITELGNFVDDIQKIIEEYLAGLLLLVDEKNFEDSFVEDFKEAVLNTQDSVLDSYVKQIKQMEALKEILDFMINNRDDYVLSETGVSFEYHADQEHYYSLMSNLYSAGYSTGVFKK